MADAIGLRLPGIAPRRMVSALLWGEPLPWPEQVVGWFGAMQAQDYEPAKWAVAMRTTGSGNADLDRAVDEGRILRTHALRPTWHFVLPTDIRWLQAVTGPRVHVLNGHYYRLHGLDKDLLKRCERLITRWLETEGDLTRNEIGLRLGAEGIEAEGNRLAYILISTELNGMICSGSRRGRSHTYGLVSKRAQAAVEMDEDEALAELTFRYFRSHGPATVGDLRWWSSLTVAQIRRGLALVEDRLQREKIGDLELWSTDPTLLDPRTRPSVHLLQPYDEYTVAFSETKRAVDAGGITTPFPVVDGRAYYSSLIVDGQLAGRWRRTLGRSEIEVEVRASRPLNRAERDGLDAAVSAYGRFHGLPVTLTVV